MSNPSVIVRAFLRRLEECPTPWMLADVENVETFGLILDADGHPVCRVTGSRDYESTAKLIVWAVNQTASLCETLSVTDQQ